jgi:putative intracellular protease/amidase
MEKKNTALNNVAVLLFDRFETLDVFGPVEILGRLTDHYSVHFYSEQGKMISNQHGITMATRPLSELSSGSDVFLIPGGPGTRREIANKELVAAVRRIAEASRHVLTVCTGSALLAATGLLNGRKATSNKRAFDWATTFGVNVQWIKEARWTIDGKYYTSSGVSAGMDMTLGFLRDIHGEDFARTVARHIEYQWQEDSTLDPFTDNAKEGIPGLTATGGLGHRAG